MRRRRDARERFIFNVGNRKVTMDVKDEQRAVIEFLFLEGSSSDEIITRF
jgi:hypothetical protein